MNSQKYVIYSSGLFTIKHLMYKCTLSIKPLLTWVYVPTITKIMCIVENTTNKVTYM